MRKSLQFRILYSFMLVVILVWLGMAIGMSILIREYFFASKEKELVSKGFELAEVVSEYQSGNIELEQLSQLINSLDSFLDSRVWIVDRTEQLIAVSIPNTHHGMRPQPHNHQEEKVRIKGRGIRLIMRGLSQVNEGKVWTRTFYHPYYEENMLIAAVPVTDKNGQVFASVILNSPIRGMNQFLQRIYLYIGLAGLLAILLTVWIVNRLAQGIVKPLKEMQVSASAMARGNYQIRVQTKTDDEVGELGNCLNSLAEDLAAFVAQTQRDEKLRRDFVANVSHELRTPLTIIRGYHEAISDGTVSEPSIIGRYQNLIQTEIIRLERLIKDLLDLSRLQERGFLEEKQMIPLDAIVKSVTNILEQKIRDKNITLGLSLNKVPEILGNGDRLLQLCLIILDNAIKYTPVGGNITAVTDVKNNAVFLEIRDTGPGIPADDLPYIWERFYKVDKSHGKQDSGTGLGLAIAHEIIEMHGAKIEVDSNVGIGTVFKIFFPIP